MTKAKSERMEDSVEEIEGGGADAMGELRRKMGPLAAIVAREARNDRAMREKAKYMALAPNLRDPLAPVPPAAELLEAQIAQCVDLVHQLGFIAGHPKCPEDERYHLLGSIANLLQSSATVGEVVGRLRGGAKESCHRVIVQTDKGEKKRGEGVRRS